MRKENVANCTNKQKTLTAAEKQPIQNTAEEDSKLVTINTPSQSMSSEYCKPLTLKEEGKLTEQQQEIFEEGKKGDIKLDNEHCTEETAEKGKS